MSYTQLILVCRCRGKKGAVLEDQPLHTIIEESGIPSVFLDDLCSFAALDKEELLKYFRPQIRLLVFGCPERSLRLLLGYAGIGYEYLTISVVDRFSTDAAQQREALKSFAESNNTTERADTIFHNPLRARSSEDWTSWYPLIDYSRCNGCGQCADFCIFGVYEKTGSGVRVVNPQGCKDQCPACARLCPQAAIVFPKYTGGGAIGGAELIDENSERERIKNDTDAIAKGDIVGTLRQRAQMCADLIQKKAMERALRERDQALAENENVKKQGLA